MHAFVFKIYKIITDNNEIRIMGLRIYCIEYRENKIYKNMYN